MAALDFVPIGAPHTEIVNAANDWPADLIVIGSHGRGGIRRVLLGSVAEGVMRNPPCPVLIVRTRNWPGLVSFAPAADASNAVPRYTA